MDIRTFQERFKNVSRILQECFKNTSRTDGKEQIHKLVVGQIHTAIFVTIERHVFDLR